MGAEAEEERGPERTCVQTGQKAAPEAMLRFVLDGEGEVFPDLRRKLPGRGVWTMLDAKTVEAAARKQAFSRGFKKKCLAPANLAGIVDDLLEKDALQFLSLVNKAGLLTTGAAKVDAAARGGKVRALIHAAGASRDGIAKLSGALRASGGGDVERTHVFTSAQLDLALGKTNVIHVALGAGEASEAFLAKVRRLARYRGQDALASAPRAEGGDAAALAIGDGGSA